MDSLVTLQVRDVATLLMVTECWIREQEFGKIRVARHFESYPTANRRVICERVKAALVEATANE